MGNMTGVLTAYAWRIVPAIVILLLGILVGGLITRLVSNILKRTNMPLTTRRFITSFLYIIIIIFAIITAVAQFEIDIGPLVVGLAVISFIVGLALQGTLSNFAAGIMILAQRPFQTGDLVQIGSETGEIKEVTLTSTIIETQENVKTIFPNFKVLSGTIQNYSARKIRRVGLPVEVGSDRKISEVIKKIQSAISDEARVLKEPPCCIDVRELSVSGVKIMVKIWCQADEADAVSSSVLKSIKENFEKN